MQVATDLIEAIQGFGGCPNEMVNRNMPTEKLLSILLPIKRKY
jgi:hypothetical protein